MTGNNSAMQNHFISQQLPRVTQQVPNPLALCDDFRGEPGDVPERIPVSLGRAPDSRAPPCMRQRRLLCTGERHDPPARVLALQSGLASIGRVMRAS
ncbi:hypothetical protein ACVWWK_001277 [Bradyrhizobium sp. LB9.1b]